MREISDLEITLHLRNIYKEYFINKNMNEKRVLLGVVFGIIVLSVVSVSAGFWSDLFTFGEEGDLEGELAESATATVQIEALEIPDIVFISDVDDGTHSPNPNAVLPYAKDADDGTNPDGTVQVTFYFLAQSGGGWGSLYPGAGDDHSNAVLINPGPDPGDINRGNVVCISAGRVTGDPGYAGDTVRYECTIDYIYYYDFPGATWEAEVTVTDMDAQTSDPAQDTFNNKAFTVETVTGGTILPPEYFNWTTPALTVSTENDYADDSVIVYNLGNDVLDVDVQGSELPKDPEGTPVIDADRFRVEDSDATQCDTSPNILNNQVSYVSSDVVVIRAEDSSSELYACITYLTDLGLLAGSYQTTTAWDVMIY